MRRGEEEKRDNCQWTLAVQAYNLLNPGESLRSDDPVLPKH